MALDALSLALLLRYRLNSAWRILLGAIVGISASLLHIRQGTSHLHASRN